MGPWLDWFDVICWQVFNFPPLNLNNKAFQGELQKHLFRKFKCFPPRFPLLQNSESWPQTVVTPAPAQVVVTKPTFQISSSSSPHSPQIVFSTNPYCFDSWCVCTGVDLHNKDDVFEDQRWCEFKNWPNSQSGNLTWWIVNDVICKFAFSHCIV